jgi:hypothetical protein
MAQARAKEKERKKKQERWREMQSERDMPATNSPKCYRRQLLTRLSRLAKFVPSSM